jgi:hypothetical protein
LTGAEAVVAVQDLKKGKCGQGRADHIPSGTAGSKGKWDGGLSNDAGTAGQSSQQTAEDVIALIKVATSVDQVEALSKDDSRKTVKDAAAKRIASLQAQ